MTAKIPSAELVTEAYLRTKVDATFGVTTTLPSLEVPDQKGLPKDNWGGKRLWVTPQGYGASTFIPLPSRKTILSVVVWGKPYDRRRHWGDASALCEQLIEYGMDWYSSIHLEMPYPNYRSVELTSFRPLSAGRRIEGDPQGLARIEFDVELFYSINPA